MHPILIKFSSLGISIHTYGLMVALGFLAALFWIGYAAKREHLPVQRLTDFFFLMMVTGVIGSRITYILVEWKYFIQNPAEIVQIWKGGLVFYGGVLTCIPVAIWYLKKHQLSFWKIADLFAPALALGHALGRVGCFFAGCCYGKTCPVPKWYSVTFPAHSESLAPAGVPLYPVQLFEAGGEFFLFLFLIWYSRKKAFDGQILLLYLMMYSILRFCLELLRGDAGRGSVLIPQLSTSQFISIILFVASALTYYFRRGRKS